MAKRAVDSGAVHLRRWWCRKYNRPPNDPAYLELAEAEIMQEWLEDLYAEKADLLQQLEDPDLEDAIPIMQRINRLSEALGETDRVTDDPLIDKWEAQLARGEIPDLTEGLDA